MPAPRPEYRVFLAYAHEDEALAAKIVGALKAKNIRPRWDQDIPKGVDFYQELRTMIAQAHIVFALITDATATHPWVHQELGVAIALNIPILTITTTPHPTLGMLNRLQAIYIDPDGSNIIDALQGVNINLLIETAACNTTKAVEIVDYTVSRSEALRRHATNLLMRGEHCTIRQRGPVSSFSIPLRDTDDPIWEQLGGEFTNTDSFRKALHDERAALEAHARAEGCRLLLNPVRIGEHDARTAPARIRILIEFLESMPDDKVTIAIVDRPFRDGSLLAIGDWVMATAHSPIPLGYRQSVFITHAPTILGGILTFDEQLTAALHDVAPNASRSKAIQDLRDLLG